jgi:hypothetical protein
VTDPVNSIDNLPVAAGSTSSDRDKSTNFNAGDVISIKFSEGIDVSQLAITDLSVNNSHTLGSSTIAASDEVNGYATVFDITLAADATVTAGDTITADATKVVDASNNQAASGVDFTVADFPNTNIVVVDFVNGRTSSHDGGSGTPRTFDDPNDGVDEVYTIYFIMQPNSPALAGLDFKWKGADNLTANDNVYIVSSTSDDIIGKSETVVNKVNYATGLGYYYFRWVGSNNKWVALWNGVEIYRYTDNGTDAASWITKSAKLSAVSQMNYSPVIKHITDTDIAAIMGTQFA